ncbi:hypothetical protein JCM10207_005080 [Rhodosporidiobolus poonsookiae]
MAPSKPTKKPTPLYRPPHKSRPPVVRPCEFFRSNVGCLKRDACVRMHVLFDGTDARTLGRDLRFPPRRDEVEGEPCRFFAGEEGEEGCLRHDDCCAVHLLPDGTDARTLEKRWTRVRVCRAFNSRKGCRTEGCLFLHVKLDTARQPAAPAPEPALNHDGSDSHGAASEVAKARAPLARVQTSTTAPPPKTITLDIKPKKNQVNPNRRVQRVAVGSMVALKNDQQKTKIAGERYQARKEQGRINRSEAQADELDRLAGYGDVAVRNKVRMR